MQANAGGKRPIKQTRPRVIVLGGGFGGLEVLKGLSGKGVDVVLVDRTNHHVFQPLLYQVATAALSTVEIAQPIRSIMRGARNVTVRFDEAVGVDLPGRRLLLADGGALRYDMLVSQLLSITTISDTRSGRYMRHDTARKPHGLDHRRSGCGLACPGHRRTRPPASLFGDRHRDRPRASPNISSAAA